MIANCIYDSNVSFSTFLSLSSTRLTWKPRQFPSLLPLLPLLVLIPKIRKTLGRLSPCMTNVLRSHRIFLVAVIIVPPVRSYLSVVSSFPSCLIIVDIIVVIIVSVVVLVSVQLFHSFAISFFDYDVFPADQSVGSSLSEPSLVSSNNLNPRFTCHKFLIKPSAYIRRIELVTSIYLHIIYIYIDKSRFQAIFKLSRVDRVRGS